MFVLAKGASKERCFRIAQEIVDEVTAVNPKPVKLKFEKVKMMNLFKIIFKTLFILWGV